MNDCLLVVLHTIELAMTSSKSGIFYPPFGRKGISCICTPHTCVNDLGQTKNRLHVASITRQQIFELFS